MNTQTRPYRQRTDLYSKVAVARMNAVSIKVLQYHIDRGAFAEPSVGDGRKYYTPKEAEEIAKYWAKFTK